MKISGSFSPRQAILLGALAYTLSGCSFQSEPAANKTPPQTPPSKSGGAALKGPALRLQGLADEIQAKTSLTVTKISPARHPQGTLVMVCDTNHLDTALQGKIDQALIELKDVFPYTYLGLEMPAVPTARINSEFSLPFKELFSNTSDLREGDISRDELEALQTLMKPDVLDRYPLARQLHGIEVGGVQGDFKLSQDSVAFLVLDYELSKFTAMLANGDALQVSDGGRYLGPAWKCVRLQQYLRSRYPGEFEGVPFEDIKEDASGGRVAQPNDPAIVQGLKNIEMWNHKYFWDRQNIQVSRFLHTTKFQSKHSNVAMVYGAAHSIVPNGATFPIRTIPDYLSTGEEGRKDDRGNWNVIVTAVKGFEKIPTVRG